MEGTNGRDTLRRAFVKLTDSEGDIWRMYALELLQRLSQVPYVWWTSRVTASFYKLYNVNHATPPIGDAAYKNEPVCE